MKKHVLLCLVLGCCIVLLPMGISAKTLKIGALWPLSGPIAKAGNEHVKGAQIATDMLNEAGGLWGNTKVKLVTGDAVTPKAAMEEAERLITKEKVNIIMGTWSSSRGYTASSVSEKHKKIYWETACFGNEIMERGYKYIFHIGGLASDFGEMNADFIKEQILPLLGKKPGELKVATIYEDSLYGTTTSSYFVKKALLIGFKVVMIESYSHKTVDLSSTIMRLKKAAPDVLFHVSYFNDQVLFTRQARELDFNVKAFLTCGPQGDPAMMAVLKSDINYLSNAFRYCGEFYDGEYTVNLKPFKPKAVKTLKEFFKRYSKRYNVTMGEIPPTALLGFNGAWILYNYVLPKAGSDDPEAVRKAALSLDEPYGTTPIGMGIKFAPPGHPHAGLNLNFTAGIFQWQNQKFYCIWPKEYQSRKPMLPVPLWKDR